MLACGGQLLRPLNASRCPLAQVNALAPFRAMQNPIAIFGPPTLVEALALEAIRYFPLKNGAFTHKAPFRFVSLETMKRGTA
jgi:hypothetical protein